MKEEETIKYREEGRHEAYEQITELDKMLSLITPQDEGTYEWYEKLADTILKAPFTRIAIIHGLKSMHEYGIRKMKNKLIDIILPEDK